MARLRERCSEDKKSKVKTAAHGGTLGVECSARGELANVRGRACETWSEFLGEPWLRSDSPSSCFTIYGARPAGMDRTLRMRISGQDAKHEHAM